MLRCPTLQTRSLYVQYEGKYSHLKFTYIQDQIDAGPLKVFTYIQDHVFLTNQNTAF